MMESVSGARTLMSNTVIPVLGCYQSRERGSHTPSLKRQNLHGTGIWWAAPPTKHANLTFQTKSTTPVHFNHATKKASSKGVQRARLGEGRDRVGPADM